MTYCPVQWFELERKISYVQNLKIGANEASAQGLQNEVKNEARQNFFGEDIASWSLYLDCERYDEVWFDRPIGAWRVPRT